ncbi:hypothetical protein CORC01_04666 [Colletotrichum orchidophilum]|uniref:Uncharacterized protein n=1 Tax=Colletotrichum orchidophilum TaxID=1209926 RepID=A0A1G4BEW1_9PEZI|nr:uncharacterized protein CORC01_04666 [Colletotrichum orchidophilum]OHF00020.1 hypothetical protein CORC01_04666 [Colletotrichum orchidophilum]
MPPSSTGAVYNYSHKVSNGAPTGPTPVPVAPAERPAIPVSSDLAYSINRYVDTPAPSDRHIRAPLFTRPLPSPSPEEAALAGSVKACHK